MPKKTLYTIAIVAVVAVVGYVLWKRRKPVTSVSSAILPAELLPTSKLGSVTNWIGDILKAPSTQSTIGSWFN